VFFDEILAAPTTAALLISVYERRLPALDAALERYLADTNPLTDAPSRRVLRFARLEVADMLDYGRRSIASLVDRAARQELREWLELLEDCLAAASWDSLPACQTAMTGWKPIPRCRQDVLCDTVCLRPGPPPRRALPGSLQPGRQRRIVPVQLGVTRRGPRR